MMRLGFVVFGFLMACAPAKLGQRFRVSPREAVKLGVDNRTTVQSTLGAPQRRFTDPDGREVFVYLWADGEGAGEKYMIAFNTEGVAYLVEAVR